MKLLTSSIDANKISRSVKGFLTLLLPFVIMFSGLQEGDLTPIVDGIVDVVFLASSLLGAAQLVFGLGRKLYLKRWSA